MHIRMKAAMADEKGAAHPGQIVTDRSEKECRELIAGGYAEAYEAPAKGGKAAAKAADKKPAPEKPREDKE